MNFVTPSFQQAILGGEEKESGLLFEITENGELWRFSAATQAIVPLAISNIFNSFERRTGDSALAFPEKWEAETLLQGGPCLPGPRRRAF